MLWEEWVNEACVDQFLSHLIHWWDVITQPHDTVSNEKIRISEYTLLVLSIGYVTFLLKKIMKHICLWTEKCICSCLCVVHTGLGRLDSWSLVLRQDRYSSDTEGRRGCSLIRNQKRMKFSSPRFSALKASVGSWPNKSVRLGQPELSF